MAGLSNGLLKFPRFGYPVSAGATHVWNLSLVANKIVAYEKTLVNVKSKPCIRITITFTLKHSLGTY